MENMLIEKGYLIAKDLAYASELGVISQDRDLIESPILGTLENKT